MRSKTGFILVLLLIGVSCSKEDKPDDDTTLPVITDTLPDPYYLKVPLLFPTPVIPAENPMTVQGVELGGRLYSDPILSSNGLSCSSCHDRAKSFSSPLFYKQNGYKISVPPHVNLAFKKWYNWTGSETYLDTLCVADFGPEFFNTDSTVLFERLSSHAYYATQFRKAFGIKNLNNLSYTELKKYIAYAITQYMRTLVSSESRYDKYRLGPGTLTETEKAGMNIFFSEKGDCFHCHTPWLFADQSFHNNGLNNTFTGFDLGREMVTGNHTDRGLFLTPTLRNVAQTAPYMHDGRFATLEEVVEFYNSGVKESATLDPIMYKRQDVSTLGLTNQEKIQLVAFLKTLSDSTFLGH